MKFGHMDEMDNIDNMHYILKHDHVNDTNELNKMMPWHIWMKLK
jgi:hypothetical protein